jgi:UDP-GlcNAc:undecaprenyl-phosphate/decaprenyl-phosphate GlcNAc-1-phosphate transferase
MHAFLLLGAATFLLSLFLTPVVRTAFGGKTAESAPPIGGLPIALACLFGCILLLAAGLRTGHVVWAPRGPMLQLFGAALLAFSLGLIDDLNRIEPWHKVVGQIIAACIAYRAGVQIHAVAGVVVGGWSLPLTVIWILTCSTAIHLLNRGEGLAAGIGLLASLTTFIAALLQNNFLLASASAPLAAGIFGFLPYSFGARKMLLGESGSLLVGFMLGCYSILWSENSRTAISFVVPMLVLSVPLLDAALVLLRRFLRRQPLGLTDTSHIYHRLLNRGLSKRRVLAILYGCSAIGAIVSVLVLDSRNSWVVIVFFYGAAWICVRDLGYVELQVARRMFMEGAFLRQIHAEITLHSYEHRLKVASTPEEYWAVVIQGLNEFGFHEAQLSIADALFEWHCGTPSFSHWEVSVPIADFDRIRLSRAFGSGADSNGFASFVDLLRRSLTAKRGIFLSYNRTLKSPHAKVGE